MSIRCVSLACAAGVCMAGAAHADIVTAQFTSSLDQGVDVDLSGGHNGGIQTVQFHWVRTDSPPGPGIDTRLASAFTSYCVDLGQTVGQNTNYTFDVRTPAQHGWSALQDMLMGRLWASHFDDIEDDESSAAFQMAAWEIAFDTGADLDNGLFEGNSPNDVKSLAQTWLDDVSNAGYTGGQWRIYILHSASNQDQVVPTPGSIALMGLAGLSVMRRRRES